MTTQMKLKAAEAAHRYLASTRVEEWKLVYHAWTGGGVCALSTCNSSSCRIPVQEP